VKERISISLSKNVLTAIDRIRGRRRSRSALIQRILKQHFREVDLYREAAQDLAAHQSRSRAAQLRSYGCSAVSVWKTMI
jgi:hypothetical protein